MLAGSASAFLLAALDWATHTRESHAWLVSLLPLAGFLIGWVYLKFGQSVEAGNNLLLEEIHDPRNTIPLRMTPLILWGTIMGHLFGGSVGREGTALQTGASLADQLSRPLRLTRGERRTLLMAGISGGFASVFGTPLAGAVFGMEVLSIGRVELGAMLPCFVAAVVGHLVALAWGAHHTVFRINVVPEATLSNVVLAMAAGAVFGFTARAFSSTTHAVNSWSKRAIGYPPLRLVAGGAVVASAVFVLGTQRYVGLGISVISAAFVEPVPSWDFALKFLFTAVTLGMGFKGGEVTPLFFIGATLGNALTHFLPLPLGLLAGIGFVSVFAGCANTPLASTLMAMELFGSSCGIFAAAACLVSYLCSGHSGIYRAQRVAVAKH